jgi:hypothetical protein
MALKRLKYTPKGKECLKVSLNLALMLSYIIRSFIVCVRNLHTVHKVEHNMEVLYVRPRVLSPKQFQRYR